MDEVYTPGTGEDLASVTGLTGVKLLHTTGRAADDDLGAAFYVPAMDGSLDKGDIQDGETTPNWYSLLRGQTVTPQMFLAGSDTLGAALENALVERHSVYMPDGTTLNEFVNIEIPDCTTFRVTNDIGAKLMEVASTGATIRIFSKPRWIEAVKEITVIDAHLADDYVSGDSSKASRVAKIELAAPPSCPVKKGDRFRLISNQVIPEGATGEGMSASRLGEVVTAGLDADGCFITLSAPLRDDYPLLDDSEQSYNVRLAAISDSRLIWEGGFLDYEDEDIFYTDGTPIAVGPVFLLQGLVDSRVTGLRAHRSWSEVIRLIGCVNTTIDFNLCDKGRNANVAEGFAKNITYMVSDIGGQSNRILGLTGNSGVRHVITTGSSAIEKDAGSDDHTERTSQFGRTRDLQVLGVVGHSTSNSPIDTHNECDGVLISGCTIANTYAGSKSGGGATQARGRNVTYSDCQATNCQEGLAIKTYKNGYFSNLTFDKMVGKPLFWIPGESAIPQDIEGTVFGGRFGSRNTSESTLVSLRSANGTVGEGEEATEVQKAVRARLIGGAIVSHEGTPDALDYVFDFVGEQISLELDATVDLTLTKPADPDECVDVASIFHLQNDSVVRGKLRIQLGDKVRLTSLFHSDCTTCTASIDLDVEIEGEKDVVDASIAQPFGFDPLKWPNARVKGVNTAGVNVRLPISSLIYTPSLPDPMAPEDVWLSIPRSSASVTIVHIVPAADFVGGTNYIHIDPDLLAHDQTLMVTNVNDGGYIVQLTLCTLGPNQTATYQKDASGALMLIGVTEPTACYVRTTSFTTSHRATGSRFGLNSGTGTTRTVTLHDDATVGTWCEFHQMGAGQWTFQVASGTTATFNSIGGADKTAGQYAVVKASCVANSDAMSAEWILSGDLTT